MPLAQVQGRYWAGAAVLAAAVAAILVVLLTRGGSGTAGTSGVVPVRLSAAPATLTSSTSCAMSSVDLELTLARGAKVTGADLVALGRMSSTERACPGPAPAGALVVRIPATASTVPLPELATATSGSVNVVVLPPAKDVSCIWQIIVSYTYHGDTGTVATAAFAAP
jgi:hypothetical protein